LLDAAGASFISRNHLPGLGFQSQSFHCRQIKELEELVFHSVSRPPESSCPSSIQSIVPTSWNTTGVFTHPQILQCFLLNRRLFGLQVLLFPLQASRSGFGDKPDPASPVLHFPLLSRVVEFEVAGPSNLKLAEFI
jgi:hypothetical protein